MLPKTYVMTVRNGHPCTDVLCTDGPWRVGDVIISANHSSFSAFYAVVGNNSLAISTQRLWSGAAQDVGVLSEGHQQHRLPTCGWSDAAWLA